MDLIWILAAVAGFLAIFYMGARAAGGGRERVKTEPSQTDGRGGRDLGANVNPSQTGNRVDLWPDRTGAQTRRELGARHAVDMTFAGDREEHHDSASERPQRRAAAPGSPAGGGGRQPTADLKPEDHNGENRVAPRTTAPDQPPTQWHPEEHGVPGDHYRDGHHRSATAPERKSTAADPGAHAPVPGPNHVPPEGGVDFPDGIRP